MKILKDFEKNNYLIKNGFIVLDSISDEQLIFFKNLYQKWHESNKHKAFYKSYFSDDVAYKFEVEDLIISNFKPLIKKHFFECSLFGGMFVVKPSGEQGHLPPHQDYSFVNEHIHWSLNMWCPLTDVSKTNGNMQMLPGSHKFLHTVRGFNTQDQYFHQKEFISNHMVDIPMKAGQIIFFFHGILHGSTHNQNHDERVSLGLSLIQKNIPIYYHHQNQNDIYPSVYKTHLNFYKNFVSDPKKFPSNVKYLGKTGFPFSSLSNQKLEEKINQNLQQFELKYF